MSRPAGFELSKDFPIWLQQRKECFKAFHQFQTYLMMGPNRSLMRLAEIVLAERRKLEAEDPEALQRLILALNGKGPARGTSAVTFKVMYHALQNLSFAMFWSKRCAAYDAHVAAEARAEHTELLKAQKKLHIDATSRMMEVALAKLEKRLELLGESEMWSVEDIRKWMNDGIKLGRLSMGEAETISENQHNLGNMESMSLDQRKSLFEKFVGNEAPPENLDDMPGGRPIITKDDQGDLD